MMTFKQFCKKLEEDGEMPMPANNTTNDLPDRLPVVRKKRQKKYEDENSKLNTVRKVLKAI